MRQRYHGRAPERKRRIAFVGRPRGSGRMTNDEFQMTKETRNPKQFMETPVGGCARKFA